ncbi:hypothetical protein RCH10_000751 [Variovorax sp. GrIS 2.14]|uniref:DUF2514 family protein n=1 Tax=Variovorax sp. GrIS 2.14 TaxID=3071709 RepID=UPI0038F7BC85
MKAFLGLFDVMPGFLWALLLAGALALLGVRAVQISGARAVVAEARLDLANYKTTAAESARIAEHGERAEEARRVGEQRKALNDAAKETDVKTTELATAVADRQRLLGRIAAYSAAARRASEDRTPLPSGASASGAIGVLADVLGRCDLRAQRLAEIADARGIAGRACERSYDALSP